MRDHEIDALLQSVRPAGPPPWLRERLVEQGTPARSWPWVAAAAALLAMTIGLQLLAAGVRVDGSGAAARAVETDEQDTEALSVAFGDDAAALQAALRRRELDALRRADPEPTPTPGGMP